MRKIALDFLTRATLRSATTKLAAAKSDKDREAALKRLTTKRTYSKKSRAKVALDFLDTRKPQKTQLQTGIKGKAAPGTETAGATLNEQEKQAREKAREKQARRTQPAPTGPSPVTPRKAPPQIGGATPSPPEPAPPAPKDPFRGGVNEPSINWDAPEYGPGTPPPPAAKKPSAPPPSSDYTGPSETTITNPLTGEPIDQVDPGMLQQAMNWMGENPGYTALGALGVPAAGYGLYSLLNSGGEEEEEEERNLARA